MNIYLIMSIGGLIGILLHVYIAMSGINKRNDKANMRMIFDEYMKSDWFSLIGSVFFFTVMLFVASEFVNLNKIDTPDYSEPIQERLLHFKLSNFIKLSSVLAGYFADSIVYGFLGVAEQKLKQFLRLVTPDNKQP